MHGNYLHFEFCSHVSASYYYYSPLIMGRTLGKDPSYYVTNEAATYKHQTVDSHRTDHVISNNTLRHYY